MGVEYAHYLLPARPSFRPSAERIARFASRLASDGWVLQKGDRGFAEMVAGGMFGRGTFHGDARRTGALYYADDEKGPAPIPLRADWLRARKRAVSVRWLLTRFVERDGAGARYPLTRWYYERESAYLSIELHWSRYYVGVRGDDAPFPQCTCGASLDVSAPYPLRPAFRSKCPACGAELDATRWRGLYRFAFVVDCEKSIPEDTGPIHVDPRLKSLVEESFACPFIELGVIY